MSQQSNTSNVEQKSFVEYIKEKIVSKSWIIPPLMTIILGDLISFLFATIVSAGWSYIILGGTACYQYVNNITMKFKIFDVVNVVVYTILAPIAFYAGEDFSRLWAGVIVIGSLLLSLLIGLAIDQPFMKDEIPLGENEQQHPMFTTYTLSFPLTFSLSLCFKCVEFITVLFL